MIESGCTILKKKSTILNLNACTLQAGRLHIPKPEVVNTIDQTFGQVGNIRETRFSR